MSIKSSILINAKIVAIDQGDQLDSKVKDVLYDPKKQVIRALLTDASTWSSDAKVIPLESVKSVGEDAVMIPSRDVICAASKLSKNIVDAVREYTKLKHIKIITEDGIELGHLSDIVFDLSSGKVTEFEVSQGLMKDMQSGAKHVPVANIVSVGADAIIVTSSTKSDFEAQAQTKGWQGAILQGIEKTKKTSAQLSEQLRHAADEAEKKIRH